MGNARFGFGKAAYKSAGGEEFGVEESGAGSAANEIVGEQSEFHIEKRAFANAADNCGQAVTGMSVPTGLRTIITV